MQCSTDKLEKNADFTQTLLAQLSQQT